MIISHVDKGAMKCMDVYAVQKPFNIQNMNSPVQQLHF